MPTWKLPYTVHNYTNEEFLKAKADYVAKYGYSVYLPGWEDVVHIGLENSFTEDEEIRWHKKDWDSFTPIRLAELQAIKAKRKAMYQRLLSSPQPAILQTRGSIITALDNTQDGLSALSMIIRVAYSVIPRVWGTLLAGPVGWIMTAADILNLCTHTLTPEYASIRNKRIKDKITEKNPFSRKARIRRQAKLFKRPLTSGAVLESLQTTDLAFGYGISLGALMNLPLDMFFGNIRTLSGEEVTIKEPIEQPAFWKNQASLAWKSLTTIFTTEKIFDVAEALPMLILSHLAAVAMHVIAPTMDPDNRIIDLESYTSKALEPRKSYLREVMEEAGDDPDGFTGWPLTGEKYASCTKIAEHGTLVSTRNFYAYCQKNKYNLEAFYAAQRAVDAVHFTMAAITDDGSVEYDYIAAEKVTHSLLNAGYRFPYNLSLPSGYYRIESDHDYNDIDPSFRKRIDAYYDFPDGLSKLKTSLTQETINIYSPQPRIEPAGAPLEARHLDDRFPVITSLPKSSMYTLTQAQSKFIRLLYLKGLQKSPNAIHDISVPQIVEYLESYESIGKSPSTPQFITWCKDVFGIVFPINSTPSDTSILPEILPPPEIP